MTKINYQGLRKKLDYNDRVLVILRDELYKGRWFNVKRSLEKRLRTGPYIYNLAMRLKEDLKRIEKLSKLEERYQKKYNDFNLNDLLKKSVDLEKKL